MLNLIKKTRNLLLADNILKGLVHDRIYMSFKPIVNNPNLYPQVTLHVDDGPNYNFLNVNISNLYINIWNKGDGAQTTNGEILERVLQILNQKRFDQVGVTYKTYRYDKISAMPVYEDDTGIYYIALRMKVITTGD